MALTTSGSIEPQRDPQADADAAVNAFDATRIAKGSWHVWSSNLVVTLLLRFGILALLAGLRIPILLYRFPSLVCQLLVRLPLGAERGHDSLLKLTVVRGARLALAQSQCLSPPLLGTPDRLAKPLLPVPHLFSPQG